jgi:ABC-type enterochelin transport system ATPase subunit
MIELIDVHKTFDGNEVLKGISTTFEEGKITAVVGTNGCGKTTILNITEAIITGMLFKLFDYAFESISLQYCNTKKCEEVYEITIKRPSKRTLYIDFDGSDYL